MKLRILFLINFGLLLSVFSQQLAKDTSATRKTIFRADSMFESGDYENSMILLTKAADTYSKYHLVVNYLLVEQRIADCLSRQGKYDQSQELAEKSLKEINTLSGPYLIPKVLFFNSLGYALMFKGRNDLALDNFKKALSFCTPSMKLEAAECYNDLGLAYWNNDNSELALEHYLKSLAIRKEKYGENHPKVAAIYNNIGLNFSKTDPTKALEYYQKSLGIYMVLYGKNQNPSIAIAYNNIGIISRKKGDFTAALDNFEKVLSIWKSIYNENHPNVAFTYSNIGQVFIERNSIKKAEENLTTALEIYRKNFGDKHPEIANTLNLLASISLKEGKFKECINQIQQAIIANSPNFNEVSSYQNPSVLNYYNPNLMLTSLTLKAQAFENLYFQKTLKLKDLKMTLSTLQSCDTLIDHIRQSRTNKADKVALGAIASDIYENAIKSSLDLADVSLNKGTYEQLAFYFNEKNKSSVLLEAISESNAKQFAGIPDSLLEKEKQLKADISFCEQKLAEKSDPKSEKLYRDKLFLLNRSFEHFTHDLGKQFPEYFNLKFNVSIASATDIQKSLNSETAFLSYFVGESFGRVYIFMVTKKGLKVINVAKQPEFEKQITAMRNGIKFNLPEVFATASYNLYTQLIPRKIGSKIKSLIIIPDGKLGTIPFEAFTKSEVKNGKLTGANYLILNYSISYNYSATLLLQTLSKKNEISNRSSLLLAPIDFKNVLTTEVLPALPGTADEVKNIKDLFTKKGLISTSYVGLDATESVVKLPSLSNYSYLHFATHGVVNESHPELSEIFLCSEKSKKEDGNLYSGEIFNLSIKANLVTLSACQTGLGKVSKGEGIIGLSRALLYAGAKNIVVSLWTVSDASTSRLMVDFYDQILKSNKDDFAISLSEAKRKLLSNPEYSNPYFWAPFVLIGQ